MATPQSGGPRERGDPFGFTRRDFLKASATVVGVAAVPELLAACGESKPSGPTSIKGTTIKAVFIGGGDYEKMYGSIPQFEASSGAKVDIVFKGNGFDVDKKLKVDFAGGTVDYDVIWDHTSFFSQYLNFIEPLDQYWSADELKAFLPRVINAARKKGKLWLIPRHADISSMHYRTDLFGDAKNQANFKAQYGYDLAAPQTWKQFQDMAMFFKSPPALYGTQFAGKEEALTGRFYEVLTANGGKLFDDKWKPTFNGPEGVKSIQMFRDLYAASAMPPGMTNFLWDDVAKNWVNGTIALYTEWYGWYSYFQDPKSSKVAGKFDLARQPVGDSGSIHSGWAGAHGFSITKSSKNKAAAAALIKFLTNYDQAYAEGKIGFLPVQSKVWDQIIQDASSSTRPLDKKRLELAKTQIAEDFTTPPLIAEWIPMSNALYPRLQQVILGDKPAKAALDEAATEVEGIMRKAGYY